MRPVSLIILRCVAIVSLFFLSNQVTSQKQTRNWYFGNLAGLNFTASPPTSLTAGVLNVPEGCSCISDTAGNLLFYTDGMTVYNKLHQVMTNGTGLAGTSSPAQGVLIVKNPVGFSNYYIFTVQGSGGFSGLCYSEVDLNFSGGLGSVINKNMVLYGLPCCEALAAVGHCNGFDSWVVSHEIYTNNFRSYRVTAAGVNSTAVISSDGTIFASNMTTSCMKISPNGRKLGIAVPGQLSSFEIFDFDNKSGSVANGLSIGLASNPVYGCEFSSDGSKFYGSRPQGSGPHLIQQWDLCGTPAQVQLSKTNIASPTAPPFSMQLGPDRKIYVARQGQNFLAVINSPDNSGAACSYVEQGQSVGTATCLAGLPNFMSSYFRAPSAPIPKFTTAITCGTISFTPPQLNSACAAKGDSAYVALWDFGDPAAISDNTSTQQAPQHYYALSGTYTVTMIVNNNCIMDTVRGTVIVYGLPVLNVTPNFTLCQGASAVLSADGATQYTWSTASHAASITVSPTLSTIYTVFGSNSTGCISKQTTKVSVINCNGLSKNNIQPQPRLFPNPATDVLYIEIPFETDLKIYDVTGRILLEKKCSAGVCPVELTTLLPGSFFGECSGSGGSRVFRFIKTD
jgi:PKD repeat protein